MDGSITWQEFHLPLLAVTRYPIRMDNKRKPCTHPPVAARSFRLERLSSTKAEPSG